MARKKVVKQQQPDVDTDLVKPKKEKKIIKKELKKEVSTQTEEIKKEPMTEKHYISSKDYNERKAYANKLIHSSTLNDEKRRMYIAYMNFLDSLVQY